MQGNFEQTTEWLLVHEGGYVNHPKDPGGATNRGVTQRVYDGYRIRKNLPTRSVRSITDAEVYDIYRTQYWDAIHGDELPAGLDYAMYDFAVNSGPSRAIKFLQKLLRIKQDGVIGNVTLAAVRAKNDVEGLITDLCLERMDWVRTLSTFSTFGKGWTRRILGDVAGAQPGEDHGVIDRAILLFRELPTQAPTMALPGKADEADVSAKEIVKEAAKDDKSLIGMGVGAVPAVLTGLAAVPAGPIQWALSAILVLSFCLFAYVILRRYVKPT